jgi:RNA polymerase sigma-70 factor (ECF subfamily)
VPEDVGYAHGIPPEIDDAELVRAAQDGDRAALDQLLRRHYDRIHAVSRRIAGSTRDADDACQEALIKIVRALPTFDGRAAFGTWAYRIATNAALDELRKRKRRPALRIVDPDDDGGGPPEPVDELGHRLVDAVVDRLAIDEALHELSDEFRDAVILRDVADLDYDEIAAILDVPLGTVKSRIALGRRLLVDRLRLDELPSVDVTRDPGDIGNRAADFERPTDLT